MATNTYVALQTITASASSTVSFTSISSAYTDLVLVAVANSSTAGSSSNNYRVQFNGDTTALYSNTIIQGNGTTATSARDSSSTVMYAGELPQTSASAQTSIFQIMNYSNTTTYKTLLSRGNSAGSAVMASVGLWRSTAAINRVDLFMTSATLTGTFSLYGILAEGGAKATGGVVTSDSSYYYHTFLASGTFTPKSTLSCDVLVVAGGGGGGGAGAAGANYSAGSGGGAGGYRTLTASSIATAQTVTIGAGGAAGINGTLSTGRGTVGVDSVFGSTTSTGGGGGGNETPPYVSGTNGGSGGGANQGGTAGISSPVTSPVQGFAGGVSNAGLNYPGAGGGGSSAVGASPTTTTGGNGGAGTANSISGSSVTYAGGGAGGGFNANGGTATGGGGAGGDNPSGTKNAGTAGSANFGGGGGGSSGTIGTTGTSSGGAGGSGIVIVRYAKV